MLASSWRAASSSSRLRPSVACRRLGVTASKATTRRVSRMRARAAHPRLDHRLADQAGRTHAFLEELLPGQRHALGARVGEQLPGARRAHQDRGSSEDRGGSNVFRNGTVEALGKSRG